jgi:radical SAM protein with 4Fe4S-binding SPASM domain
MFKGWTPKGHHSACGAGRSTLGIEADGTIKGCPSLDTGNWGAGNIRDASLLEIWERGKPMRYTRRRSSDDLWGYCKTCYYADVCLAGCTWMADMLLGKPGNNPFCHHRALQFAAQGKRERVERVREAPGKPFDQGLFRVIVEDTPRA